jgi:amino acid permease
METSRFDLNRKISSFLAFTVIIVLSIAVALLSFHTADEILKTAPNSKAFNLNNRIDKQLN